MLTATRRWSPLPLRHSPSAWTSAVAGDRLQSREPDVPVVGEIDAARPQEPDDPVEVGLRVGDRHVAGVLLFERLQFAGRPADGRVRSLFARNHPLHGERSGDAHRAVDDRRLVDQLLVFGVRSDARVHFVPLRAPRGAVGGQRLLQGLRPVRIRVERDFPRPPRARRNPIPIPGGLPRREPLERLAGRNRLDPGGMGARQQPTAHVGVGCRVRPFFAVSGDELADEPFLQPGIDGVDRAVEPGERVVQDRFVPRKDRVERRVAGDASKRHVGHRPAIEGQALPGGFAPVVHGRDPRALGVARYVLGVQVTQPVVVELRRQESVFRESQCDPAGVDRDPATSTLFCSEGRSPAATSRIQNQITRIAGHQD